MGRLGDGVKTFNSTVRTILAAVFVGIVGWLGYFGYSEYTENERVLEEQREQLTSLQGELKDKEGRIEALGTEIQEKEQQIDRLNTAMRLLKTDQRLARLTVRDLELGDDGEVVQSTLEFVELSPNGEALSEPKLIELPGDIVYVDNWIVKFDDQYIEKGDIERGTSLCLFHRIFSEQQMPSDGVSLDEIGMRPQAYGRGGEMSEFEKSLWKDFWEFANDEQKATEMGIRAAHGEAISIKVKEGKGYNIRLRASGGLSFEPFDVASTDDGPTL